MEPYPEDRENYVYKPLTHGENIRLLTLAPGEDDEDISLTLKHYKLDEAPSYDAVSYTWGRQNPLTAVLCNGQRMFLGPTLTWGLKRVRERGSSIVLWVDAVCINQKHNEEKSEQVQQMYKIYSAAANTLIWLGPALETDANVAISLLERADELARKEAGRGPNDMVRLVDIQWDSATLSESSRPPLGYVFAEAICGLLDSAWFTRIWIIQEIAAAKNRLAYFGHRMVKLDTLCTGALWIQRKSTYRKQLYLKDDQVHRPATLWDVVKRQSINNPRFMHELIPLSRDFHCQNPRDKIFSLLGICREGRDIKMQDPAPAYKPDYSKSVLDVIGGTIRHLIESREEGDPWRMDRLLNIWWNKDELLPDWPSWVPRLHQDKPALFTPSIRSAAAFAAAGDTEVETRKSTSEQVLAIKGIVVDTIKSSVESSRLGSSLWQDIRDLYIEQQKILETDHSIITVTERDVLMHQFAMGCVVVSRYSSTRGVRLLLDFLDWWKINEDKIVSKKRREGISEDEISNFQQAVSLPDDLASGGDADMYVDHISSKHNLAVTTHGLFGSVCRGVQPDDVVCVLYGCAMPIVLRPADGQYRFLGLCSFPVLREGAALSWRDIGRVKEEWFEIK